MKTFKILSGLAMGLAFASCSSDDLADNGTIAAVDEVRFLKVALCNPGSGPANRALSGDDKYETGTDAENTVQEVRFVFYDKNGERVSNVVSIQGNNCGEICQGRSSRFYFQGTGNAGLRDVFRQSQLRGCDI